MIRRLCILLTALLCGCSPSYFGASILRFSSQAHPERYTGPVFAVAGDGPAEGFASLEENYSGGTVVLADFEQNAYLSDGVWDLADWAWYREMIKYAPTGGECMVILLGWRADGAHPELTKAREGITDLAATRVSPVVLVDFRPDVEAHPEWFAPGDPIHPATAAGLAGYADRIASGVDACPD